MTFRRKQLLRVHTFNGDSYKKNFVEKILELITLNKRETQRENCFPVSLAHQ